MKDKTMRKNCASTGEATLDELARQVANLAATSFTVVSDTEIAVVSPAQAAGTHNIYVTTPSGTSAPGGGGHVQLHPK
jgi:hypothetical protein